MVIPEGDVGDLARDMVRQFAADAVDRATLVSNALFVLGQAEKSKKWLLIRAEIEKIQSGGINIRQPTIESNDEILRSSRPYLASPDDEEGNGSKETTASRISILIALVAWSELLWVLSLKT